MSHLHSRSNSGIIIGVIKVLHNAVGWVLDFTGEIVTEVYGSTLLALRGCVCVQCPGK